MIRNFFNALAALLLVLLVIIWVDSYFRYDHFGYGWKSRHDPDRVIGLYTGWGNGQLQFSRISYPMAWEKFVLSITHPSRFSILGFQRYSQPTDNPANVHWPDFWFQIENHQDTVPANADGTIAINAQGSIPTAPRQLPRSRFTIGIPLWLPILLIGAAPAWRLLDLPNRRRRKCQAAGQCVSCGYDLRASPERCPECGTIPNPLPIQLTATQRFLQFCKRSSALRAIATPALFILTLISSTMICEFISQAVIHRRWKFMETWTPSNGLIAGITFCALYITCSSAISLWLFDRLRATAGPRPLRPRTSA